MEEVVARAASELGGPRCNHTGSRTVDLSRRWPARVPHCQ
jgi:hypothetical protein